MKKTWRKNKTWREVRRRKRARETTVKTQRDRYVLNKHLSVIYG